MTAVSPELLRRFDVPGPRYTSYPTADRFVEAFGQEDYALALSQRRLGTTAMALPLSLYVHIPFCRQKCFYCDFPSFAGREALMAEYTQALCREIAVQGSLLREKKLGPPATIYIGGGTPTALPLALPDMAIL